MRISVRWRRRATGLRRRAIALAAGPRVPAIVRMRLDPRLLHPRLREEPRFAQDQHAKLGTPRAEGTDCVVAACDVVKPQGP